MHRFSSLLLLVLACAVLAVPAAQGATSSVVISQVFGGGGNSGAPYTNDFVELLNRGASPVDLSNTTAALRADAGCTDTNSSVADFTAVAPSPRNSASPAASCSATTPPGPTASTAASVAVDLQQVLSIALERPSISFGSAVSGATPSPISERVTVV